MHTDSSASAAVRRIDPGTPDTPVAGLLHPIAIEPSAPTVESNTFVDLYHPAVKAFIAAVVRDSAAAHGLTQKFFVEVVVQGQLNLSAERPSGRFHGQLKEAVRDFLVDERRYVVRKRRGRAAQSAALVDQRTAEWDGVIQPPSPLHDAAFLRGLAHGIVRTALRQVFETFKQKGRQQHFRLFVGRFLVPTVSMPSWRALGEPFALDERTARARAEITARHVRAAIRELVAAEGGSSDAVDEEIRALISLFPEG